MDAWGSARGLGDIDVLARLREQVSRLDIVRGGDASDVDAALQVSREAEEMREFEEGILAEALLQSKQEALAMAGAGEQRRFQVIALGYTRAGESEMCSPDDRTADLAATVRSSARGAWKAAVPLFCFVVIQTNSFGEEQGRSCITKSREDFEALHEKLQDEVRARCTPAELSRLHAATRPHAAWVARPRDPRLMARLPRHAQLSFALALQWADKSRVSSSQMLAGLSGSATEASRSKAAQGQFARPPAEAPGALPRVPRRSGAQYTKACRCVRTRE